MAKQRKIVQVRFAYPDVSDWWITSKEDAKGYDEQRPISRDKLKWRDVATLLDNDLEDENRHSVAGMYETLGELIARRLGAAAAKKILLAIWDQNGLFD